jgi:hypothetical protein
MNRTLSAMAAAAILLGAGLTGCGGTNSAENPSNAEVTAAVTASARELDDRQPMDTEHEREAAVSKFMTFLNELRQVPALAPLFDKYGVPNPVELGDDADSAGLIRLLRAVRISVSATDVTISNRATGAPIYQAPLANMDSGTFHPENMPGTTTPPPPPPPPSTCTSFTYSAWGACQSNGTQTRTVTASSPSGCTGGMPMTSQSCTYVPPPPPPPATCTSFTYSTWGACQPSNTQTRTVLVSTPSGCTGGSPVTSQACTYVPPVTTCSSFTYSAWGACQPSNTQTRTVTASAPSGCTGGSPVTSQACTYVPPVTTCSSFTYSAWGACQPDNTQTRTVTASAPSGCTGGTPVTSQACTYTPPLDGAALYAQSCAGCHGALASSNLKGKNISLSLIKSKGMTQGLTDAQLQAIVTAVGP